MDAVARFKVLKDRFDHTDLEDATAAGEFLDDLLGDAPVFAAPDEARADYLQLRGIVRFVGVNASPELFTGEAREPVVSLATPRRSFYAQELGQAIVDLDESMKVRASIVGHDQEKIAKAKRARSAAVQLMNAVSELEPDDG